MAIMCRCVEISLLGCVEQNVVQNVPSLTRFLPIFILLQLSVLQMCPRLKIKVDIDLTKLFYSKERNTKLIFLFQRIYNNINDDF